MAILSEVLDFRQTTSHGCPEVVLKAESALCSQTHFFTSYIYTINIIELFEATLDTQPPWHYLSEANEVKHQVSKHLYVICNIFRYIYYVLIHHQVIRGFNCNRSKWKMAFKIFHHHLKTGLNTENIWLMWPSLLWRLTKQSNNAIEIHVNYFSVKAKHFTAVHANTEFCFTVETNSYFWLSSQKSLKEFVVASC